MLLWKTKNFEKKLSGQRVPNSNVTIILHPPVKDLPTSYETWKNFAVGRWSLRSSYRSEKHRRKLVD